MPSVTPRQRRFFGAELGRKRAGLATKTGLSESKLSDFASTVKEPKPKPPKQPGLPKSPKMAAPAPRPKPVKSSAGDLGGIGALEMAVKKPSLTGGY